MLCCAGTTSVCSFDIFDIWFALVVIVFLEVVIGCIVFGQAVSAFFLPLVVLVFFLRKKCFSDQKDILVSCIQKPISKVFDNKSCFVVERILPPLAVVNTSSRRRREGVQAHQYTQDTGTQWSTMRELGKK